MEAELKTWNHAAVTKVHTTSLCILICSLPHRQPHLALLSCVDKFDYPYFGHDLKCGNSQ